MVTPDEVTRQRMVYGALWDPVAEALPGPVELSVDLGGSRLPTARRLRETITDELRRRPDLDVIEVRLDGERLGVSSRVALQRLEGRAGGGETPSFGAGDRASLAGESTQYRALHYVCTMAGCTDEAFQSFHDARFPPKCERDHVAMELRA